VTVPAEAADTVADRVRPLTVCLVGMPNSGKTTLMNALTGGNFHTANYPGVTVSLLRGTTRAELGAPLTLVDLPGVHSPVDPSPEEELSCQVIESRHSSVSADAFALVVDATQLERHLKFAGFVARQGKPLVLVLTMMDLLPRIGATLDIEKLSKTLGLPVIAVGAREGKGIAELVSAMRSGKGSESNALAGLSDEPVAAYSEVRALLAESGALVHAAAGVEGDSLTERIDRIALHRVLGFPVFFGVLIGIFASIFWMAQPFMDAIDTFFGAVGNVFIGVFPSSILTRFVAEGLIGGVGAVAIFFPQIVILFFLMTLLEDSGYLARGATLVDRPLSYLGLHGRSFVPMLSGFACAIPAVFASRSIPTMRERLLTIWIIPLMSCSARLPVYALLLAALLPGVAWTAGLSLAAIYVASLLIGSAIAGIVGRLVYRNQPLSILAMELPVYRVPRWKIILKITWSRSSTYLRKAGGPIVVIAMVLWLLSNFGLGSQQPADGAAADRPMIVQAEMDFSLAAQLGQVMEPVLEPMGVDWRVGVGLISAFAAREVFVSAMAIVFHVEGGEDTQAAGLLDAMRTATFKDSNRLVFTPSSMIGLIVFFFFSLQCVSTVAVVWKETNSWRFTILQLVFYTVLGYVAAVAAVQGLRWVGFA
jgi:ferrous iron transport protein B